MKQIKITTSKGRFRVVDEKDYMVFHLMLTENGFDCIELKEITEEETKDIISFTELILDFNNGKPRYCTFKESLHSLLKSKGINLFRNPYTSKINPLEYKQAEQKTFYNPYIFKIN